MNKIMRIIKLVYSIKPLALISTFFSAFFEAILPYITIFFTGTIINSLMSSHDPHQTLQLVLLYLGLRFTLSILLSLSNRLQATSHTYVRYELENLLAIKSITMEYTALTDSDNRLKYQKASEGSNFNGGITTFMSIILRTFLSGVVTLGISITSIISLVTLKSTQSTPVATFTNSLWFPLIIIVLVMIIMITVFRNTKKGAQIQLDTYNDSTFINRRMSYFSNVIFTDNTSGKTLRLYDAGEMVIDTMITGAQYFIDTLKDAMKRIAILNSVTQTVVLLSITCLYILVGAKVYAGAIGLGSLLIYVGYFQSLIDFLVKGLSDLGFVKTIVEYLQYYIDYLELPDSISSGDTIKDSGSYTFRFEDVSFKYPNSDTLVLKNITTTINPNERISVVGQNGAGKTTFIMLLCRLYTPTSGKIYLNDTDINTLNLDEYYDLLSVVFQDFVLYPFSIKENITMGEAVDIERIQEGLEITGLSDKISKLENGLDTSIKGRYDEGVALSGGEAQKLAITRAWYKDSPLVILDEPTAALDPISEYEIYTQFDKLMDNKSAIYVSHRMSSCRFCDRVIVFDDGRIVQDGHHDELIKKENDLYHSLFNAQAQFYI